jgi:cell division septation protein DedD
MRNNETGEYELVVGNKQLLSGFFIVVLLCAVAFAMGYVVGENSHIGKPAEAAAATPPQQPDRPDAAPEARAVPPAPTPDTSTPAAAEAAPPESKAADDAPPQPTTRPAREVQREPAPVKRAREVPAPEPPAAEPVRGQYWQVAATTNRDSAENLLQSLKEKGFPASLSPGPNSLTRVLVGPYADTTALGRAKTELEANGFRNMVRK